MSRQFTFILIIAVAMSVFGVFQNALFAANTGKIAGRVTDAETQEPLVGVNVVVIGTDLGAATDPEGYYTILNVPPGTYILSASMMGYQELRIENVQVTTEFTTKQNFDLNTQALEAGEEVVVEASRPDIQRDRTSTQKSVSADQLEKMPIKEFNEAVEIQAGVVNGHFRGGRAGEVTYMIDGMSVSDPYNGEMAVQVENNIIQEVKVISGTFSAEYGQALSGVVNITTKTGADRLKINGDLYAGDFVSNNAPPFMHIRDVEPMHIRSGELSITGPLVFWDKSSFYLTVRDLYSGGYLYGQEQYLPSDSSDFSDPNPQNWHVERSGDGDYVPMNWNRKRTYHGKLAFKLTPTINFNFFGNYNTRSWQDYNHLFKYNPQGIPRNYKDGYQLGASITHSPNPKLFYTVRATQYYTNHESYVYKDPEDDRYVNEQLLRRLGYGFFTGGMNMNHFYRNSRVNALKFNLTTQPNRLNEIKVGAEYRSSNLWLHEFALRLDRTTDFEPQRYPPESVNNNKYRHIPYEIGFWLEDKVELERLILSVGLRYDYFEPDGVVPKDLRDPDGTYQGLADPYKDAEGKSKWSPRLGISYPITDQGAIHISYGHFFQIPNFEYLYQGSEFEVAPGGLNTILGNADLSPKKTVIYELGLQQMLLEGLVADVTGYYKDIRDLVGTQIYELYILGDRYARYENQDYGNVRGITISLTQKPVGWFSGTTDYTYQIAEGNASDPRSVFLDRQSDPPRATEIQTVPLDWDQRHSLNFTLSIVRPNWGVGIIGKYGSGLPYTPEYQNQRTSFENSSRMPSTLNFDLKANYTMEFGGVELTLYSQIKNMFDRKNPVNVFNDTGSPSYSLIPTYVPEQPLHSLDDFLTRPDYFAPPRQVIVGIKFGYK